MHVVCLLLNKGPGVLNDLTLLLNENKLHPRYRKLVFFSTRTCINKPNSGSVAIILAGVSDFSVLLSQQKLISMIAQRTSQMMLWSHQISSISNVCKRTSVLPKKSCQLTQLEQHTWIPIPPSFASTTLYVKWRISFCTTRSLNLWPISFFQPQIVFFMLETNWLFAEAPMQRSRSPIDTQVLRRT